MSTDRNTTILRIGVGVVTLIAGSVAAVLGYFEYKAHQQDTRIERVMTFSDTLSGATEGYRVYAASLQAFSRDFWRYLDEPGELTPDQFVIKRVNADPALHEAMTAYTRFFDLLAICVAENLCDERTARAVFVHDLEEFHNLAYPWLTSEQKTYGAHGGQPLICLRNHFRASPPPERPPPWQVFLPPGPCANAEE